MFDNTNVRVIVAAKRKTKTQSEWAVDIWGILIQQAMDRKERITYGEVGKAIGYNSSRIGKILEHIDAYCRQHRLPLLTVLVVEKATGKPASGMDTYSEVDYREVYGYDWQGLPTPTAAGFEEAMGLAQSDAAPPPDLKYSNIRDQIVPFSAKKPDSAD